MQRIYPNSGGRNVEPATYGYSTEDSTLVVGSARGRIIASNTPMLPMLSQWSLFESLRHATPVASRSSSLSQVSQFVSELLATLGIPLAEVRTLFSFI